MKSIQLCIYTVLILAALFALTFSLSVQASEEALPCEHSFGEWILTQAPTCTQKGEVSHACTVCQYTESATVSSPGHLPSGWIIDTQPQQGIAGSMHIECNDCGEVLQTDVIAPLPGAVTEPEQEQPTTEPAPEQQGPGWIEIPLPLVIGICILPNLILVIVLIVRAVRKRVE